MNHLLLIAIVIVLLVCVVVLQSKESFWGGWFPVLYQGQPLTRYARAGLDAATDAGPKLLVDPSACPINPYCQCRKKGYPCPYRSCC